MAQTGLITPQFRYTVNTYFAEGGENVRSYL